MAYVAAYQGYVADVPEFWFKRIDGKIFHYNKLTQATVTPNVNFTEVNAGWGLYPVAYLPAAATLEAQITSGQFDSSQFALANGGDFEADATFKEPVTEILSVTDGLVTLSTTENIAITDVVVNGLTQVTTGDTMTTGNYKVTKTGSTAPYTITVLFNTTDFPNGTNVEVNYAVTRATAKSLGITNNKVTIGECIFRWPVYNGGENLGTDGMSGAAIKGYIFVRIFRARITAVPGFDTSYKSAATNSITVATMDPDNAVGSNGNAYVTTYVPVE